MDAVHERFFELSILGLLIINTRSQELPKISQADTMTAIVINGDEATIT